MAMTRTEMAALAGVALLHLLLFAWLSLAIPEPAPERPPMAVEIIAEPAVVSTAPEISSEEPAAALGEPDLPPAPSPPEPAPPLPAPPRPAPPRPVPPPPPTPKLEPDRAREQQRVERERTAQIERRRVERERQQRTERERTARDERERTERARAETARRARAERERLAREARNRPGGDPLGNIESNVRNANGRNTNPPAQQTVAEIRADIRVSINAEVRGPWNGCRVTGVDVDRLRTAVVFRLAQSGALDRIVSVNTSGVNDSNRPQVQRFEECARRAITLAAPFNLPSENYQYWQTYTLDFDRR